MNVRSDAVTRCLQMPLRAQYKRLLHLSLLGFAELAVRIFLCLIEVFRKLTRTGSMPTSSHGMLSAVEMPEG
jgi:hypothetical protein